MEKHQCCKMIYPNDRWGSFHGYQCTKKASICINDKWYCGQHDPEKVKKREEESYRKYREKLEAEEQYRKAYGDQLLQKENLELKFALLDLLNLLYTNEEWYQIEKITGLSSEHCEKIVELYEKVYQEVGERWLKAD